MVLELLKDLGEPIILIIGYALIGGSIKYIDQAFDIDVFNKKIAQFLAIPTAILMALYMALNHSSATIFLAIVLGLALTKKIDNLAFQVGLFFLIVIPIFFSEYIQVQWLPFTLLLISCIGDEYTNDWADVKIKKRIYEEALGIKSKTSTKQKILEMLFEHRVLMKLMVIILSIVGLFQPIYILAFLAFDFSYKLVEIYSFRVKKYHINSIKPNPKALI